MNTPGQASWLLIIVVILAACDKEQSGKGGESPTDTISGSAPAAYGRFVPEREDDFAWENDKVAFRVYGPASTGQGPVSGVDAWFKKVGYLVIDKWYADSLKGKSYHEDRGEGYDRYHTGTSRGVGGTAIWIDGSAFPAGKFLSYEIRRNGGGVVEFELQYAWDTPLGDIEETKTIILETGNQLYRVDSRFKLNGSPAAIPIAIGLTTHDEAADVFSNRMTGRISTWETIDGHGVGTGAIIDSSEVRDILHLPSDETDASHIWLVTSTDESGRLEFSAGFAWQAAGEFTSSDSWNDYLDAAAGDRADND